MNFNLDDPLAEILSDGSDDSFFDDDISKKKPPKRTETNIADKKSTVFDLGDKKSQSNYPNDNDLIREKKIQKEPVVEEQPRTDNLKSISPTPFKKTNSKEPILEATKSPGKSKFDLSTDNILNDFGIQPKKDTVKIVEKGKSSQSLLDDILGSSKKTSGLNQTTKPTTTAKKQSYDLDSILDTESRPTNSSAKVATQKSTTKSESVKEVSQSKKKSSDDWLGIFQDKENIMEEDDEEDDVPAWLGGGGSKKKKNVKEPITESHLKEEVPKEKPKTDLNTQKESNILDHVVQNVVTNIPSMEVSQEDVTMQGTALYLQQQESQLMVALQLKAQDEKLAAMQSKITTKLFKYFAIHIINDHLTNFFFNCMILISLDI